MDCPNCNIKLPFRAAFFQYFYCSSCKAKLVRGKETSAYLGLGIGLAAYAFASANPNSIKYILSAAPLMLLAAFVWSLLNPVTFRIKELPKATEPKEEIDIAENIKNYKAMQAAKRKNRKWFT